MYKRQELKYAIQLAQLLIKIGYFLTHAILPVSYTHLKKIGYARSVWAMISMNTRKPADLLADVYKRQPARRVMTREELAKAIDEMIATDGPFLLEACLLYTSF